MYYYGYMYSVVSDIQLYAPVDGQSSETCRVADCCYSVTTLISNPIFIQLVITCSTFLSDACETSAVPLMISNKPAFIGSCTMWRFPFFPYVDDIVTW